MSLTIRITGDAREDEMEQNLVGVGNILGNLKNMANDMGAEIQRQNEHLDRIDLKVGSLTCNFRTDSYFLVFQSSNANTKIAVANKRTEKLL